MTPNAMKDSVVSPRSRPREGRTGSETTTSLVSSCGFVHVAYLKM